MTRKADQISRSLRNAVCNAETGDYAAAALNALEAVNAYQEAFDPHRRAFIHDVLPGLQLAVANCDPEWATQKRPVAG